VALWLTMMDPDPVGVVGGSVKVMSEFDMRPGLPG